MKTRVIQIKYNGKHDLYDYNSETNMLDVISNDCSKNPSQMQPGKVYVYIDGIHALVIYCKTDKSFLDLCF